MLRANAVDERYLTSYTAYRTSGGLAPGGGLRHAASGSEMCFCIHPRSASAHVRTPPISGAHFSPLYCTTGYHHNTQHTTHPTKPNQHTVDNKTPTTKNTTTTQTTKTKPKHTTKHHTNQKRRVSPTGKKGEEGKRGEEEEKKGEEEERGGKGEEERRERRRREHTKKACGLPDGESNPGHPRDRRGY